MDIKIDQDLIKKVAIVARWVLTFELFLGRQARMTDRLTSEFHRKALSKKDGYFKYLPFTPGKGSKQQSQIIGALVCTAGGLLCTDLTQIAGAILSAFLSLSGWYSQAKMGVQYRLPVVNTILAALIIYAAGLGS